MSEWIETTRNQIGRRLSILFWDPTWNTSGRGRRAGTSWGLSDTDDCPMCGDALGSYAYCLEHGELA